jgi:hypothetical protein
MRTIVIYGFPVKTTGRNARSYQDPDDWPDAGEPNFVYPVTDDVDIDDVLFYIEKRGYRIAPIDGMRIGIDDTTPVKKGAKAYSRMSLGKAIERDFKKISLHEPNENHHTGRREKSVKTKDIGDWDNLEWDI